MFVKDKIRQILREETEGGVITVPPLKFFGDDSTLKGRTESWKNLLSFVRNRKYIYNGDLDFSHANIKTLGNLVSVKGSINLRYSSIESLGSLVSVEQNMNLEWCPLMSLGNLETIGGFLILENSSVESLGNLKSVGSFIDVKSTPLSIHMTKNEIRDKVEVGSVIYF